MNILVVSQYYYPEQFFINDIATELVKRGHSVTVLTGLPNYPKGQVEKEYRFFKNRQQIINGVKIVRCFEIGRRKSIVFLALNYLSFMVSAILKVLFMKEKFDVVYCYQLSPITTGLPAIVFKNKNKVKLLLYCLDIWPESIKSYIKNENSIFYRILKRVSSYVYKNCDLIACTSEAFMDYIELEHGISINKMIYLPQHGDSSYLNMDLKASKNNYFNFMFAGHIGIGQDIDCIINAVELIDRGSKFKVHLVGDGNYLTNCKKLVKEKQLDDKIIFHGRIDKMEMPKYYKMADACIITLKNITKVGLTIPGKLQTYMAAGKPIVGAIDGDASKIIRNASCGYCVNSGDSVGLANIMIKIMNSNNLDAMGNNARRYYEDHFTLEIHMDYLEKLLLQLR